jgi:RNA polymerase sigma factor (TIGR02999 family)
MNDEVLEINAKIEAITLGQASAAEELLPLVYSHLRRLARARMAHVPPGNTLQPTALVHEAYLRVVGEDDPGWNGRGHFFAAAAEAMRQILVDQARQKGALKRGGDRRRLDVEDVDLPIESPADDLLDLDRAIKRLERKDPQKAQIVVLRYFAGLNREETAAALNLSKRTLDRQWEYIRAWLHRQLKGNHDRS